MGKAKDVLLNIKGKPKKVGSLSNNEKCSLILELMQARDILKVNLHNAKIVIIISKRQRDYFKELANKKSSRIKILEHSITSDNGQ